MALSNLILVSCVLCAGAIFQSITGFGFAMLAAPLIALIAPELVPGPLLVLTFILTLSYGLKHLRSVAWRDAGYILLGRLPLSAAAALAVAWLDPDVVGLLFGSFLCISVLLSRRKVRVETTLLRLVLAGGLSGFFGTITSVAAPPLAIVYQSQPADILRATLAVNIIIGTGFSLLALAGAGALNWQTLGLQTAFGLPAVLLGSWFGARFLKNFRDFDIRNAVLGLAGAASLALAVKSMIRLLEAIA